MTRYAITRSITVAAATTRLSNFLADPAHWPRWPNLRVQLIRPLLQGSWKVSTPIGLAELRVRRNPALGNIEYLLLFEHYRWSVPGRILPNGSGSELVLTFFQHEDVSRAYFEQQMVLIDQELAWLKKLMDLE